MKRELRADVAVIGAGAGGLTVAGGCAQLGLSVVLFEHGDMGGDCLNVGCVPSKALIAAAHRAHGMRGDRLGVRASGGGPEIDFAGVMAHVRGAIETIAPVDSQERFEGFGVTVVRETAAFADPRTIESDSVRVRAQRVVVATGTRPTIPPIPGLREAAPLTNETVFGLARLPERLLILGGGPIGCELGQAFGRLGSKVTIVEGDRLLGKESAPAADLLRTRLTAESMQLREEVKLERVDRVPDGIIARLSSGETLNASHILVAVGRTPNLEQLRLGLAGVETDKGGIVTADSLRARGNRRVFGVGDIAGRGAWTHLAGAHGALFIRHALFHAPASAAKLVIPRVTYTDPEIASVGMTEAEARARYGDRVQVLTSGFNENDRAIAEGETEGFATLLLGPGKRPLGVTLVGPHAGELIALWSLVLSAKLKLSKVAAMSLPYPTRGEISGKLAREAFSPALFAPSTRLAVSLLKRLP